MNCQFCQQPCKMHFFEEDANISAWYDCFSCNVSYRTYCKNGKVELTRFHTNFRNKRYCLDLDVTLKITEIMMLPEKVDDTIVMVLTLPYLIEGLTPDNFTTKLETYLIFS